MVTVGLAVEGTGLGWVDHNVGDHEGWELGWVDHEGRWRKLEKFE